MGRNLALWFVYAVIVAFAGHVLALWPSVIWYGRSATTAAKATFDGLLFALATGGVFGWLWP